MNRGIPSFATIAANSDNPMQALHHPTAAGRVYRIAEIRARILHLLSPSDLTRFMRVEKGCMMDVSRELYRTVKYARVVKPMSDNAVRQHIYSSSVTEVDARSMLITLGMQQDPRWWPALDDETPGERAFLADRYDPALCNIVVPDLRRALPNLRKIRFGTAPRDADEEADDERSCTIRLLPAATGGVVDLITRQQVGLKQPPKPRKAPNARKPPRQSTPEETIDESFTIRKRYIVSVYIAATQSTPAQRSEWLDEWLKSFPLENVHSIEVEHVPIPLDALTLIYGRQAGREPADRLQRIKATISPRCALDAFRQLAQIASSSLTSLKIGNSSSEAAGHTPAMSFRDLPALTTVVRNSLPNLTLLQIGIPGLMAAEADCAAFLSTGSLRAGGTLKRLRIHTAEADQDPPIQLFNLIRVLSSICDSEAEIAIGRKHYYAATHPAACPDQTPYLQYLRRQPHHCRSHLATIDFPSIGITTLRQVLHLNYDDAGIPLMPTDSLPQTAPKVLTSMWAKHMSAATEDMSMYVNYHGGLCEAATKSLDETSATAPAWEQKALAERLLAEMMALRSRMDEFWDGLDVEGVRGFIRELGDVAGSGGGSS